MWESPQCRDVFLFLCGHYFHSLHMSPPSIPPFYLGFSSYFWTSFPTALHSVTVHLPHFLHCSSEHSQSFTVSLIICVKGFCFQAVSDHLIFLTLSRGFFSGCHLFLSKKNVNSLLIFTELTSHQP